jgi:hypothetical protein
MVARWAYENEDGLASLDGQMRRHLLEPFLQIVCNHPLEAGPDASRLQVICGDAEMFEQGATHLNRVVLAAVRCVRVAVRSVAAQFTEEVDGLRLALLSVYEGDCRPRLGRVGLLDRVAGAPCVQDTLRRGVRRLVLPNPDYQPTCIRE